jgi:hypothetical protein
VKQDCRKVTHTSLVTIRPPASTANSAEGLNPFDGLDHGVQEIAQLKEEKRIRKLKRSIYLAFPLSLLVAAAFSQGFVDAQFTCIIIGMCYVAIRWNL